MAIGANGYTVRFRAFTPEQMDAAFKKIAKLGFDGIETFMGGDAGIGWEEEWKLIRKNKLKIADIMGDLSKPDELKRMADAAGLNIIWLNSIPEAMLNSADGFRAYAGEINRLTKKFRGYRLLYHNHAQEFRNFPELNGKAGLEILIEETDPKAVVFEIDTYWAAAAGADPAQWILKLKNRIPVIHFKDCAIDWKAEETDMGCVPRRYAEIGQGNINWPAVTDACRKAGVEWYCVEQDRTAMDEFKSLGMSISYMKELGIS